MAIENIGVIAATESASKKIALKSGDKIKAKAGTKYLLQVDSKDVAPENVTVKRVGKDLQISFEGSEKPDLTIEGFFAEGMDGQLYGVSEDGQLYAYVRTDGEGYAGPLLMLDGESAPIALGGDGVAYNAALVGDSDDAFGFALWPLLAGLAGVGAAAAIIHNNRDDGHKSTTKTSPAPTNAKVTDHVGPIQGDLANGAVTDDPRPSISGEGVPGAIIHIADNGVEIGTTTVGPDGKWEFVPTSDLSDGGHSIDITQNVPGENPSAPVHVIDFDVDTIPPAVPVIGDITNDLDPAHPIHVEPNAPTNDNTPVISGGGAEPGDTIHVIDNGTEIGTAVVDPNGNWSFTPDSPLADGEHDITVVAEDPAGNSSEPSAPYPIVIDTVPPAVPAISDIINDLDPSNPVHVEPNAPTNDNTPVISGGGAEPGDTIHVIDNGTEIGTAVVDPNGNWSFTPDSPLADGEHDITVVAEDPAGNSSEPSAPYPIVIDTTPVVGGLTFDVVAGDDIVNAAEAAAMLTISGGSTGARAGDVVTLIINGNHYSTTVGADGRWSIANVPGSDLVADTAHRIEGVLVATDAAGNRDVVVAYHLYDVDTQAPAAPDAWLDPDSDTGVKGDDITSETKPTIDGKTEPGADVVVTFPTGEVATTTADENGDWSVTPTQPLPEGNNDITVVATDPAGNESEPTVISVIIDTTAPVAPDAWLDPDSDTGVKGDDITSETKPTIDGKTEPGADVVVTFPTGEVATTTA
ncbi:Ig-like domain-containing protein, partial [Pseudomonas pseudonitroreducens]|uniref:Ig-like domain-containing protein n=2 Tax=Pseudomonas pseudonitroreducens TaxID=2892326 RepID=UPI001F23E85C